ncbi:MAG: hypothetical protein M3O90_10780 [Actinomycetota bacterium]|nr:hypothetical protein [Actinomycetota bacterium]
MPRLVVPLLLIVVLLLPAGASAATTPSYDVLKLLERPLKAVKRGSDLDVLLPSRITADFRRLYSVGRGRPGRYEFEIDSARGCHGATACFVAAFTARRGARPSATHEVTLAEGRTGFYRPMRCGASCAAPSLEWLEDDVLHTIEAKIGTKSTDRKILIRLANSAIRNGPR